MVTVYQIRYNKNINSSQNLNLTKEMLFMSVDVVIVIATILGVLFPGYLIDAIRSNDEKAENSKVKACIVFGAIVLITLMVINS